MLNAEEEVLVGYSRTFRHRLKNEYIRNWTGISVWETADITNNRRGGFSVAASREFYVELLNFKSG